MDLLTRLEVKEHVKATLFVAIHYGLLCCEYCWMDIVPRLFEMIFQIKAEGVTHPVTTSHAVRIYHRYYLEDIIIQKFFCLTIIEVSQFIKHSLDHVGRRCCATVDPTDHKYHRLS